MPLRPRRRGRGAHPGDVLEPGPGHARVEPPPGRRPRGRVAHPPDQGDRPRTDLPGRAQGRLRGARRALRDVRHVRAGHRPRPPAADGRAGRVVGDHRQPGDPDLGHERVGPGRGARRLHRRARRGGRRRPVGRARRPSPSWPAGSRGSRCGSPCGPPTRPPPRRRSTGTRRPSGRSWPRSAGDVVFGIDDEAIEDAVARALAVDGLSLGLAESLTGGLAASRLVNVPGASTWFRGSVVSYASEVKFDVLGVPEGPVVSEEAGPGHGRRGAPGARRRRRAVGHRRGRADRAGRPARRHRVRGPRPSRPRRPRPSASPCPGDRDRIRQYATIAALDFLRRSLDAPSD